VERERTGYVHPQIKLELGSLTDQKPAGEHTVTPWVAEEFPSLFTTPACHVVALELERTFWEKVTILHAEHHRPSGKPMRSRFSRDCYDVCMMAFHKDGQKAMQNLDVLERVVRYKRKYFQSTWARYEEAKPGSLRLVPPEHRLADLKADYQQMQQMFTERLFCLTTASEVISSLHNSLIVECGMKYARPSRKVNQNLPIVVTGIFWLASLSYFRVCPASHC
jgi:hypothetical protein